MLYQEAEEKRRQEKELEQVHQAQNISELDAKMLNKIPEMCYLVRMNPNYKCRNKEC
jgi:hypothetical protein